MKDDPFKKKRTIKPKKVFQIYIIRRVGTGWEITNGSVKFSGTNRVRLLELMDQWETATREALRASKVGPVIATAPKATAKKVGKVNKRGKKLEKPRKKAQKSI